MSDQQNDQNQGTTQQAPQLPKSMRDQMMLVEFIDNLIKEKNDPAITPQNLPAVRQALLEEINEQLNAHMISLLDEKQQIELDRLLDQEVPDEEIDDFFAHSIPNIEVEIAAVIINFRAAFLATFKKPSEMENQPIQTQNGEPHVEEVSDDLMPAPPSPAAHTPFDAVEVKDQPGQSDADQSWN